MQDITENILELVRLTSTDLPPDVEASIHRAVEQEERIVTVTQKPGLVKSQPGRNLPYSFL